mgnify:CR=1 FL=1
MKLTLWKTKVVISIVPARLGVLFIGLLNKKDFLHKGIHIFPRRSPAIRYFGYQCDTIGDLRLHTFGLGPLAILSWWTK